MGSSCSDRRGEFDLGLSRVGLFTRFSTASQFMFVYMRSLAAGSRLLYRATYLSILTQPFAYFSLVLDVSGQQIGQLSYFVLKRLRVLQEQLLKSGVDTLRFLCLVFGITINRASCAPVVFRLIGRDDCLSKETRLRFDFIGSPVLNESLRRFYLILATVLCFTEKLGDFGRCSRSEYLTLQVPHGGILSRDCDLLQKSIRDYDLKHALGGLFVLSFDAISSYACFMIAT